MDPIEKKSFMRQMYANDSEVGRMKLQSVKENLYEATTKVVLYSIEMYTKESLSDWVKGGLLQHERNMNSSLKGEKTELEEGHIGMMDITNGCSVLNDFVRREAYDDARSVVGERISKEKERLSEYDAMLSALDRRKSELEQLVQEEEFEFTGAETDVELFGSDEELTDINEPDGSEDIYDETEDIDELDDDDDDDEQEEKTEKSVLVIFLEKVGQIRSIEDIENEIDRVTEERDVCQKKLDSLSELPAGNHGKDILRNQMNKEAEILESLRTLRNVEFAHKVQDERDISAIGSWEPEAGPLYQWATEILSYIKVIEAHYRYYSLFDDYFASHEGKDKFDGCKVYVQKQIKELYVNRSNIVFEFAGELYDKEDEDYNFAKLIENMAVNWNTGIRYLTVVTNDDLPELNVFFKECLSGTNKYVDYYLIDRNALRDSVKRKDSVDTDYIYFNLLYHLNPLLNKIYWRGEKQYTEIEFARLVLYKLIKVKNMYQFDARLRDYEKYLDGIDIAKWSEKHILSNTYFALKDDAKSARLAREMEEAICIFMKDKRYLQFRKAIRAAVQLYFHMGKEYIFSFTRANGTTVHWKSLDEAKAYMENGRKFASYNELCSFVDELSKSDYYKLWKKTVKNVKKMEATV